MTTQSPRILLVDSYDSFTFNLASLCRSSIPNCLIHIIKNDEMTITQLLPLIGCFSAIIIGPGPGSPENPEDIGIIRDLWKLREGFILPIFGVCLGLQSLGIEYGGRLRSLNVVKHGQISEVYHHGTGLFLNVGAVHAVRYHSLHIELEEGPHSELVKVAWANDGEENGEVIMALSHKTRPFWAVQYHPESARSTGGGSEVLNNFWRMAQEWSNNNRRIMCHWDAMDSQGFALPSWPYFERPITQQLTSNQSTVLTSILDLDEFEVTEASELLGATHESKPFVLLDSVSQPGRFTIIACLTPSFTRINYFVGDSFLSVSEGDATRRVQLGIHDIWSWLASFIRMRRAQGNPAVPFWGGFVGYLSYELGVESLRVPLRRDDTTEKRHADVNLIFVDRSIVSDSTTGKVYTQSLRPEDESWVSDTASLLKEKFQRRKNHSPANNDLNRNQERENLNLSTKAVPVFTVPDKDLYISRIKQAKEYLFSGDSYELCLTARTRISYLEPIQPRIPLTSSSSWERYKHLRASNPAPYAAYMRLHPTTILSSSPERFLSYSRAPGTICQLRPIKGTLRKSPGLTRATAEKLLAGSKKEVAENLMIVDLIRHDLHGVVGEDVQVKKFCAVEEYETVYQLVSVIEGSLLSSAELKADEEIGWEVLRRSLPPGSMTGAPKKRSVEILKGLEDDERGIYSGVLGYWCVSGGGDWAVTIRSCFKFDDQNSSQTSPHPLSHTPGDLSTQEEWIIGAGGAITALSDPDEEWEEMNTKLQSVLSSFAGYSG